MVNIIEELKSKFKVQNIPARGRCIIIPIGKFQAEWDQQILEAGCDAHADGDAVYVHIENYKPQSSSNPGEDSGRGRTWTQAEDAKLINLWNAKTKNNEEIAKEFPNRTEASVVCRLGRLKKTGKIKPRWQRKKTKETQMLQQSPEPAGTPKPEKSQLEFLFTQLFELLHVLSCRQLMQELQLRELKGDFVIPRTLWRLYWHALEIKADWAPARVREYMLLFQEAATEFLAGYM